MMNLILMLMLMSQLKVVKDGEWAAAAPEVVVIEVVMQLLI